MSTLACSGILRHLTWPSLKLALSDENYIKLSRLSRLPDLGGITVVERKSTTSGYRRPSDESGYKP